MSILPSTPDIVPKSDPKVVGVDSEEADALMSALSSDTARHLVSELHTDPAPPAELADRLDTTLQNTQYHLKRLEDAGVVEVAGTAYSEKGREMSVYAPADDPLVIFAGRDEQASGLRAALKRLVGGVVALALGALAIQETFGRSILRRIGFGGAGGLGAGGGDVDGAAGGNVTGTEAGTATADGGTLTSAEQPTESATPAGDAVGDGGGGGSATATATDGGPGVYQNTETATRTAADTPTAEGASSPTGTPVATEAATSSPTPDPTSVAGGGLDPGAADVLAQLPPGLLFFLGGLLVLVAGLAISYRHGAL